MKVAGKRPPAREDAKDVLAARCGTGDTMGRGLKEFEEKRVGGKGDLEDLFEDFGLDRPGGGPDEEAMPGAKAQQAKEKVGVCV